MGIAMSYETLARTIRSTTTSRAVTAIARLSMRTPEPAPGDAEAMTRWVERQKAFQDAIDAVRALDPE
jgi:hypothetical protein